MVSFDHIIHQDICFADEKEATQESWTTNLRTDGTEVQGTAVRDLAPFLFSINAIVTGFIISYFVCSWELLKMNGISSQKAVNVAYMKQRTKLHITTKLILSRQICSSVHNYQEPNIFQHEDTKHTH